MQSEGVTHLRESLAHYDPERHAGHAQRFGMDTRGLRLGSSGSPVISATSIWAFWSLPA